eukprot:g2226.t1
MLEVPKSSLQRRMEARMEARRQQKLLRRIQQEGYKRDLTAIHDSSEQENLAKIADLKAKLGRSKSEKEKLKQQIESNNFEVETLKRRIPLLKQRYDKVVSALEKKAKDRNAELYQLSLLSKQQTTEIKRLRHKARENERETRLREEQVKLEHIQNAYITRKLQISQLS